jgi:dUTP pyrophosphatase
MLIKKVKDVKTPSRGTSKSAGIDFFTPNDMERISLAPNESALIPSGIKAQVPQGHAFIAFNKSGVATKKGLVVGACVVDEDYEGEIHIHVINTSRGFVEILPGEKLTQFILIPVNYQNVQQVESFPERHSERGAGGFGSTGIS